MNPKIVLGVLLAGAAGVAAAADDDADRLTISLYSRASRDDNLYRLPDAAVLPAQVVAAGAGREDDIFSTGLDLAAGTEIGRQQLSLAADAASVRYSSSDFLNYTSGSGNLQWNWQTLADLDGTLRASYNRFLAGFANTRDYERDVITSTTYSGTLNSGLGARWSLHGAASLSHSSHEAEVHAGDDQDALTLGGGLDYTSRLGHVLGWRYSHGSADYLGTVNDYSDDSAQGQWKLLLSETLTFSGAAGYQRRSYAQSGRRGFSGDIWQSELDWQSGGRSGVVLSGWRELRAWTDTETDHYVSTGGRFGPTWDSGLHWHVELLGSWEQQHYLGDTGLSRADILRSGQLNVVYRFLKRLELSGGASVERRTSSDALYAYDDGIFNVGLKASW